jgi:tetratricopeptide (TPR) repeat protein
MSIILNDSMMENLLHSSPENEPLSELRQSALNAYERQNFPVALKSLQNYYLRTEHEVGTNHLWFVEASCALATVYFRLKLPQDAIEVVTKLQNCFLPNHLHDNKIQCRWLNSLTESLFQNQLYDYAKSICWLALDIGQRYPQKYFDEITRTRNNLASILIYQGQFQQAEELFRTNLTALQTQHGSRNPLVATLMNNLGELCRQQYRYKEAEGFLEEALRIRKQILPAGHPMISQSLNNMAFLRMNQGRFFTAEKCFLEVLALDKSSTEKSLQTQSLSSKIGLAETRIQLGFLELAEETLEDALVTAEEFLGPQHLRTAYIQTLLSQVYLRLTKTTLAEQRLQKAHSIYEANQALNKLPYAIYLLVKTEHEIEQKDFNEAEKTIQIALRLQVSALGNDHLEVTRSLSLMSYIFTRVGRESRSHSILTGVFDLKTKCLGQYHPEIAQTFLMFARCANFCKHYDSAEHYCEQAETVCQFLPEQLPVLQAELFKQRGITYRGLNKRSEAIASFHDELKISEQMYGKNAYVLVEILQNLAYLYTELKDFDQAAHYFERCVKLTEEKYNAYHLNMADLLTNLAIIETERKKWDKVNELYDRAFAIKKARLGIDKPEVIQLAKMHIKYMLSIGMKDEAQKLQSEIDFEEQKDMHVLSDLF